MSVDIEQSNAVSVEQAKYEMIPLDRIVTNFSVRPTSPAGLARIQESMRWAGFLPNFPVVVRPLDNGRFEVVEGNHRVVSAEREGITLIPCIIRTDLSESEYFKLAMQSNNAAETVVLSTLVTYAEFIWARLEETDEQEKKKYTQSEVGEMLGWGRDVVAGYAALKKIHIEAWRKIVATFEENATEGGEDVATTNVATATFTEGILRHILDLSSKQQVELVTELATNKDFSKGKFKSQAGNYLVRNKMYVYALGKLGALDVKADPTQVKGILEDSEDTVAKEFLGEDSTLKLKEAVYSGAYDTDWKQADHPKLDKLITAIRDEWERKNSIRIVHGDFYEEVLKIEDGSIDLIVTDPPYNVASEREFTGLKDHTAISQDFGSWDKDDFHEFLKCSPVWAKEWKRILRDQGSGYVFTSPEYCSYLWKALEGVGLCVKTVIVWYKPNPGQMLHHTTYKNSVEYILFFTKGEGGHTFHWGDETEMQNHINIPVCAGNERIKDAKGNTLHPTQKPAALLRHFIQISSNGGDTVFDGFMGVGSVGAACKGKDVQRKFIGIEQDKSYFDAAQRRLGE